MSIFKGDRVIRVDGTAVGFRRNETFEAVDVSRTHIKVKNAAGLISKWFERKDFMLLQERARRIQSWQIVYKNREGVVQQSSHNTRGSAVSAETMLRNAQYTILAKKKITIPYQEAGL